MHSITDRYSATIPLDNRNLLGFCEINEIALGMEGIFSSVEGRGGCTDVVVWGYEGNEGTVTDGRGRGYWPDRGEGDSIPVS